MLEMRHRGRSLLGSSLHRLELRRAFRKKPGRRSASGFGMPIPILSGGRDTHHSPMEASKLQHKAKLTRALAPAASCRFQEKQPAIKNGY